MRKAWSTGLVLAVTGILLMMAPGDRIANADPTGCPNHCNTEYHNCMDRARENYEMCKQFVDEAQCNAWRQMDWERCCDEYDWCCGL